MRIEIKLKGTSQYIIFEDSKSGDFYEATLINKRKKGVEVILGVVSKADLKRLAKAS